MFSAGVCTGNKGPEDSRLHESKKIILLPTGKFHGQNRQFAHKLRKMRKFIIIWGKRRNCAKTLREQAWGLSRHSGRSAMPV